MRGTFLNSGWEQHRICAAESGLAIPFCRPEEKVGVCLGAGTPAFAGLNRVAARGATTAERSSWRQVSPLLEHGNDRQRAGKSLINNGVRAGRGLAMTSRQRAKGPRLGSHPGACNGHRGGMALPHRAGRGPSPNPDPMAPRDPRPVPLLNATLLTAIKTADAAPSPACRQLPRNCTGFPTQKTRSPALSSLKPSCLP